jgi:hypothetical protein
VVTITLIRAGIRENHAADSAQSCRTARVRPSRGMGRLGHRRREPRPATASSTKVPHSASGPSDRREAPAASRWPRSACPRPPPPRPRPTPALLGHCHHPRRLEPAVRISGGGNSRAPGGIPGVPRCWVYGRSPRA